MNLQVSTGGRGEICVKGPNVTKGYFKRPELTNELIDSNGWLHTGDIGEFLPDGSLKIVDRRKNIFKLAQGEYVAPEKVENIYACCPLVGQVFIDGMVSFVEPHLQWFTVAIVVPEQLEAERWAEENGLGGCSFEEIYKNPQFVKHLLLTLRQIGSEKRLNGIEQIRSICIHPELFTIDKDLLTPTMKNKRAQLRNYFRHEIERMYNEGPMIE